MLYNIPIRTLKSQFKNPRNSPGLCSHLILALRSCFMIAVFLESNAEVVIENTEKQVQEIKKLYFQQINTVPIGVRVVDR